MKLKIVLNTLFLDFSFRFNINFINKFKKF